MSGKAVVTEQALKKAQDSLNNKVKDLITRYNDAKENIESIQSAGWVDQHFKDLKLSFDNFGKYIKDLEGFMDRSSDYQDKQGEIIQHMNDLSAHKFEL